MNADTNILVIGGGGYIGSYIVSMLVASGRMVTILGRAESPRFELPNNASYVVGDFGDSVVLNDLLVTHKEVIHLAYATAPNTSFQDPLGDLLQNLPKTVQLFSAIANSGGKLVYVSSGGTVYGEAQDVPLSEEHSLKPISPYGVTKLTLENYARLYAVTHGLRYVCVRPANAYGIGQVAFSGQGFISTAIGSAIKGATLKIFGTVGTVRDYIYVSDVAAAIISALDYGVNGETYNIGSGNGFSNLDIVNILRPIVLEYGYDLNVEHQPARSYDVRVNILTPEKLYKHTGWRGKISLTDGLRKTCDWTIKHWKYP